MKLRNIITRILLIIGIIFSLALLISKIPFTKGDSGWDTNYDSGSSWGSGSSWDSGSSWSSGSSWDYSSSYGSWSSSSSNNSSHSYHNTSSSDNRMAEIIILLIFIFLFLLLLIIDVQASYERIKNISNKYKAINSVNDISESIFHQIIPNESMNEVKKQIFEVFKIVQIAWMNFDYKTLKEYCKDELYNSYISLLDALKIKEEKNIIKNISVINNIIYDISEDEDLIMIKARIRVTLYDYVVDKNGDLLRGTKHRKVDNNYNLLFIKRKNKDIKCPNCGAVITNNTSGYCEFCRSKINVIPNHFVLSNKSIVR